MEKTWPGLKRPPFLGHQKGARKDLMGLSFTSSPLPCALPFNERGEKMSSSRVFRSTPNPWATTLYNMDALDHERRKALTAFVDFKLQGKKLWRIGGTDFREREDPEREWKFRKGAEPSRECFKTTAGHHTYACNTRSLGCSGTF